MLFISKHTTNEPLLTRFIDPLLIAVACRRDNRQLYALALEDIMNTCKENIFLHSEQKAHGEWYAFYTMYW